MAGVVNDFECLAHGHFEARVKSGTVPKCPKGCSKSFVKLVHLQAPSFGSARFRRGDKLLRQAAEMQGLSDISTSPSRPGGSVAERNRMRNRPRTLGPKGREYPDFAQAKPVELQKYIGAMTHRANELSNTGFGHKYEAAEWKKDEKDGKIRHLGAQGPLVPIPLGTTGVSIEKVKD
jgi:hypothetical protein